MSKLFKCDKCGTIFDEKYINDCMNIYEITSWRARQDESGNRDWVGLIDLCPACQEDLHKFLTEYKKETK